MKKSSNRQKNKQKPLKKKASGNKNKLNQVFLVLRYLVLLGLMFTLPLLYKILTPLTVRGTGFLLGFFNQVFISGNSLIIFPRTVIEIIPACVAGSAYLLLLILNLTVPMKLKTRLYSLLFSVLLLFIVNLLRISFLSLLLINEFSFFDITHKLFWYVLSTIFVVGIWLATAYLFKIKEIPVYSDMNFLFKNIIGKKKRR